MSCLGRNGRGRERGESEGGNEGRRKESEVENVMTITIFALLARHSLWLCTHSSHHHSSQTCPPSALKISSLQLHTAHTHKHTSNSTVTTQHGRNGLSEMMAALPEESSASCEMILILFWDAALLRLPSSCFFSCLCRFCSMSSWEVGVQGITSLCATQSSNTTILDCI